MQIHLYKVELQSSSKVFTLHVTAEAERQAAHIVSDYLDNLGVRFSLGQIEQVDQTIPDDRREGLQGMLELGQPTIASFCPGVGWIAHVVPAPCLSLFKVEITDDDVRYVVAPSGSVAFAIAAEYIDPPEGQYQVFGIFDGLDDLEDRMKEGLDELLAFGPAGMVNWDRDSGWSHL